jgi:hypothetical protein
MVISNEKKVIAWKQAMERLTGIRAEDMIGRNDYEYALPFYAESRSMPVDLAGEGPPFPPRQPHT